jgi:hypothetical protein
MMLKRAVAKCYTAKTHGVTSQDTSSPRQTRIFQWHTISEDKCSALKTQTAYAKVCIVVENTSIVEELDTEGHHFAIVLLELRHAIHFLAMIAQACELRLARWVRMLIILAVSVGRMYRKATEYQRHIHLL